MLYRGFNLEFRIPENAHMFEKMIQILESVVLIVKHHLCRTPSDLYREVCAAVPGVNLAHAGEKKARNGRANRGDILGMVDQRHRLSVARPEQPGLPDPIR